VTSSHPEGCLQVRVKPRLRARPAWVGLAIAGFALAWIAAPVAAVAAIAVAAMDVARGLWRIGPMARRALAEAAG